MSRILIPAPDLKFSVYYNDSSASSGYDSEPVTGGYIEGDITRSGDTVTISNAVCTLPAPDSSAAVLETPLAQDASIELGANEVEVSSSTQTIYAVRYDGGGIRISANSDGTGQVTFSIPTLTFTEGSGRLNFTAQSNSHISSATVYIETWYTLKLPTLYGAVNSSYISGYTGEIRSGGSSTITAFNANTFWTKMLANDRGLFDTASRQETSDKNKIISYLKISVAAPSLYSIRAYYTDTTMTEILRSKIMASAFQTQLAAFGITWTGTQDSTATYIDLTPINTTGYHAERIKTLYGSVNGEATKITKKYGSVGGQSVLIYEDLS